MNNKFLVKGNSMLPLIKDKFHVIIKYTKDVNFGDIIIFKRKKYVVHRIIKINKNIITKGDNNYFFDKQIKKSQVIAKVIKIQNNNVNNYNNKIIAFISCLEGKISSKNKLVHSIFRRLILIFS